MLSGCSRTHELFYPFRDLFGTGFWWGDLRGTAQLEYPDVEGSIILKQILKKWEGGMVWINLAQNRDR